MFFYALCIDGSDHQDKADQTAPQSLADILEKHSSDKAAPAKALRDAMSTAEDAAVAYNKEAQALNEKIVKFPYNIVAKLGGYAEFPIFTLN